MNWFGISYSWENQMCQQIKIWTVDIPSTLSLSEQGYARRKKNKKIGATL